MCKLITFLLLCAFSFGEGLKCYTGSVWYEDYGNRQSHKYELKTCEKHHNACYVANSADGQDNPWTEYEFGCTHSTLKHLLEQKKGIKYDGVMAPIYQENLIGKCVYADDGPAKAIYCLCNTDACNSINNYHHPVNCFVGKSGAPNYRVLNQKDFEIRGGKFENPVQVSCGMGACAEVVTDKYQICYHQCNRGRSGDANSCFNTTIPTPDQRNLDKFVEAQICCCDGGLCNLKGKKWPK